MDESQPPTPPLAAPAAAGPYPTTPPYGVFTAPPSGPPSAPVAAPPAAAPTAPPYASGPAFPHVAPTSPPASSPPPYLPAAGATVAGASRPPIPTTGSSRNGLKSVVVGATVIASLVAGAAGGWFAGHESSSTTTSASAPLATGRTVSAKLSGDDLDVSQILAKVGPSVVAVNTEITQRRGPYVATGQGAGTGVVLTADGEILTNNHVIDGATKITVTVNGSTTALPATLIATDTNNDLALLRVTGATDLVPAALGSSDATIVGDDVVAVGNALALEGGMSVTRGIVSALHRSIEAGGEGSSESLSGLIQTDAAISSGNSGGPLVNSKGEVIGINTAVAGSSGTTTASNIGFAIPIDTAKAIVEKLRSQGGN